MADVLQGADAATFLESPAVEFAAPLLAYLPAEFDSTPPHAGSQIGPYRILREIGHGGMGSVYLAERADHQYQKTVALKLVRGWGGGNERSVRRFLEERQILAGLDHPAIARLLDGGVTADGLPWFAMEYVEGVPIDRYCDERGLSVEARLELFCRVCAAVQYAHRNLIVHRDLKPANILVTADGGVKLLDFGIAKLLRGEGTGEAASLTATGERPMTPLYASPGQIRGDPITTASDVYALGVILYGLLTGRYPYRLATREPHEVVRAILEQEPERPSVVVLRPAEVREGRGHPRDLTPAKLARRLRGDLDTIVLTAMQKDPGRRYGTAEQLEADVRRHLAGLPVTARPDSRLYRAQKFVRRHRLGVAVAAGVALLVVGFTAVTAVQSVRIRNQADRIAVERDRAAEVSRFLAGLFQTADPFAGAGAGLTASEMLDSGAARIDRELAGQPETRAQMMLEMARAYFGLGERDRARRFAEVALAIRRRTPSVAPLDVAQALDVAGLVRLEQGELDGAERAYGEALALRRQILGTGHREVARALNGLGGVLRAAGRFRAADSVSRQAVAIDEAQPAGRPLDLAESLKGLAQAVHERGGHAEAERLYRRALALERQELAADQPQVVRTLLDVAAAVGEAGAIAAADSLFRDGLVLERRLLGAEHPEVAADEARYARLLHRRSDNTEAEALYRRSLATMRRRLPAVHPLTATTLLGLGELLLARGAVERAEPLAREALAMRRTALPPWHPGIAESQQVVGMVELARGRYMEAENRYLLPSRDLLRAAYGDADPRTREATARLIALYDASGQPERAAAYRAELQRGGAARPAGAADATRAGDSTAIVVLPFRIANDEPGLADLRDVVHDLLAARFTGEGGPRARDPITVIRALRAARRSQDDVPVEAALRLGRELGAQWAVRGEIAGTPRRLSLVASLVTVPGGVTGAEVRAEGNADSLPHLTERMVARLLAMQAARDPEEAVGLRGTPLSALRAYLAGELARGRGRSGSPSEAMEHYQRALFLDSTFALAGLRLAEIAVVWGMAELDERWKLDAIWRLRGRLGPAARALLDACLGPRYPRPATLVELIAAGEQAALAAPHRVEAWRIAGEHLFRLGPPIGYPGWEARARQALGRAFALDSTDAFTLQYLVRLATAAGDSAAVRRYAELYLAHNPQAYNAEGIRWLAAVVLGDSAGRAAVRGRLESMTGIYPRFNLRALVDWSPSLGIGLEDADRAARIYEGSAPRSVGGRRTVIVAIVPYMLNRGRPSEASRLLAMADWGFGQRVDVGVLEFRVYAALHWDGDSSVAAAAARTLEAYLDGAPARVGQVRDRETAACALAHWRLATGDPARAQAALARLRQRGSTSGSYARVSTPVCVAAAEALLAAVQRRPDAATQLERLDALLRAGSDERHLVPTLGNLIAARLYEERGDPRRALALTRRRSTWTNQLLSTQLREEGRLAALVGDTAGAVRAYRHYLALRSDPEPRLRPEVARVRVELERLEGKAGP